MGGGGGGAESPDDCVGVMHIKLNDLPENYIREEPFMSQASHYNLGHRAM